MKAKKTDEILINNINENFDLIKEQNLLSHIISMCGIESFRPNLEIVKEFLAEKIMQLESQAKIVVVAGTNGKGETSHCIRQIACENNFDVCMWTSPHVLSVKERFLHNNETISYEKLSELIERVKNESVILENKLSFYEFLFCVFIYWCLELETKIIVLEVGLGGKYDAVNIFSQPLTIITSISRDHTKILGNTLTEIMEQKYGVCRTNGTLLTGISENFLLDKLKNWTTRDQVKLEVVASMNYRESNRRLGICASEILLGVKFPDHVAYLNNLQWQKTKGRFETYFAKGREWIYVGAHNLDGHRKMLELLNKKGQNSCNTISLPDVVLSFSKGREDQVLDIVKLYKQYPCVFGKIFITDFDDDKAMAKNVILHELRELNSVQKTFEFINWKDLLNDKTNIASAKQIYITGSYYFIGAVQRYLLSI